MEAVAAWATKTAKFLMAGPPKPYNPQYITIANAWKRFNDIKRKEGWMGAYNKLRMEGVLRKGNLVGMDYNGNKYYEDRNGPYGRTRWVEYPTPPGVWAIEQRYDGSMVSPEWHGWLHYMHDKTGTELVSRAIHAYALPRRREATALVSPLPSLCSPLPPPSPFCQPYPFPPPLSTRCAQRAAGGRVPEAVQAGAHDQPVDAPQGVLAGGP